jgi:4-oxalocrotonate tautomerase
MIVSDFFVSRSVTTNRISLRAGKPKAYRQAIFDSLYRAMREALVLGGNQFTTISEHGAANFRYGAALRISS